MSALPTVEKIAHVIAAHPSAVPNARVLAEEIHALLPVLPDGYDIQFGRIGPVCGASNPHTDHPNPNVRDATCTFLLGHPRIPDEDEDSDALWDHGGHFGNGSTVYWNGGTVPIHEASYNAIRERAQRAEAYAEEQRLRAERAEAVIESQPEPVRDYSALLHRTHVAEERANALEQGAVIDREVYETMKKTARLMQIDHTRDPQVVMEEIFEQARSAVTEGAYDDMRHRAERAEKAVKAAQILLAAQSQAKQANRDYEEASAAALDADDRAEKAYATFNALANGIGDN